MITRAPYVKLRLAYRTLAGISKRDAPRLPYANKQIQRAEARKEGMDLLGFFR
jgi:hypothetical protein